MKTTKILAGIAVSLSLSCAAFAQHNITTGGTYTYADGDTIAINTTQPVTLYHCTVTCSAPEIVTCEAGANVTIQDSYFASNASSAGEVIHLTQPAKATVINNHIEGGSGIGSFGIIVYGPTSGNIYIAYNALNNCMFGIQIYDIQNNPNVFVDWNQLTGDAQTSHSDQINIEESSGTAAQTIYLYEDFVAGNPDAPAVFNGAGIQAGDQGTSYVFVQSCTVLNASGIDIYYGNNNTSAILGCYCLGIGNKNQETYTSGISLGHTGDMQAGSVYNSQSGWWNAATGKELNFLPSSWRSINGNSTIPKSGITLAAEQAAYQAWLNAAANAGLIIGDPRGGNPTPTWPNPSDFNF